MPSNEQLGAVRAGRYAIESEIGGVGWKRVCRTPTLSVNHRNSIPESILLHHGEAMLTDLGIALAVDEAAGARLTTIGLSPGNPRYAGGLQQMTR